MPKQRIKKKTIIESSLDTPKIVPCSTERRSMQNLKKSPANITINSFDPNEILP